MHDGYIYTLGICGSASGSGPAPACLDLMLAALAPVKRAAYLGEVLVMSGSSPSLDDPLLAPVYQDLADADLLLLVTPLPGGALPMSLEALATTISRLPPPPARRYAVLIVFANGSLNALWPLRHALEAAEIEILDELYASAETSMASIADEAIALARNAYNRARALHPEALP
jgi:hypothetical protein